MEIVFLEIQCVVSHGNSNDHRPDTQRQCSSSRPQIDVRCKTAFFKFVLTQSASPQKVPHDPTWGCDSRLGNPCFKPLTPGVQYIGHSRTKGSVREQMNNKERTKNNKNNKNSGIEGVP